MSTSSKEMPKPWEDYPHIWPTKARFFTFLRGAMRRALWEKYPVKVEFKNETVTPPPEGYVGRAKSGTTCSLSGEWYPKSKLEVDHKSGNVSLQEWEDFMPFIAHLLASKEQMQLVGKEEHKIKSYAEKQGISFEEARAVKHAIAKIAELKSPAKVKKFLVDVGFSEAAITNASMRRQAMEQYYRSVYGVNRRT